MVGFYNCLIFWNGSTSQFKLVSYACKTTAGFINCILSTVGVAFVGRLVCSVNVLYMELSYTGSLDQSTRASEQSQFRLVYP